MEELIIWLTETGREAELVILMTRLINKSELIKHRALKKRGDESLCLID